MGIKPFFLHVSVCPQDNATLFADYCYSFFNSSFVSHSLAYYKCWTEDMWIGIVRNKNVLAFLEGQLTMSIVYINMFE